MKSLSNYFEKTQLIDIPDKEYFSIGKIDLFNSRSLVTSASFFKNVFDKDLYEVLIKGSPKISDELQYMFDVGSAFHCFCLQPNLFNDIYYVAVIRNIQDDRTFIKSLDYDFITGCYNSIKEKYPYILEESDQNELTILTKFDSVNYRCKIDKLYESKGIVKIIDLKSVWFDFYEKKYRRNSEGIRWGLIKYIQELNYDLQAHCYYRAVSQYLEEMGVNANIEFLILMASKSTYDVKMIKFSPEMLRSGKDKFNVVFPEIKNFFDGGIKFVEQEEII